MLVPVCAFASTSLAVILQIVFTLIPGCPIYKKEGLCYLVGIFWFVASILYGSTLGSSNGLFSLTLTLTIFAFLVSIGWALCGANIGHKSYNEKIDTKR